jgi:hypothetical protein
MNGETEMGEQSLLELVKNWGYYLLPKSHLDSPGYTGLLVAIRKQPTGEHFDPQTLHLRLRDETGIARWRTLSWLTPLEGSTRSCPGRVILRDRRGKSVEFFTFGGRLEVTSAPGEMVYSLRSLAPILELTTQSETTFEQLAYETEAAMGEIEAKWQPNEAEFGRRLANVDPFQFYLAALQSILLHYERAQSLERAYHEFHESLFQEKEWLVAEGLWPASLPALETLFASEP